MSPAKNRLARRRERLWKENPHCFFCGVETILPHVAALKYNVPLSKITKNLPKDVLNRMATIDHEFCRFEPERLQNHRRPTTRLACFKCNSEEGMKKFNTLPASFRKAWARGLGEFRRYVLRGGIGRPKNITLGDAFGPEQLKILYARLSTGRSDRNMWHRLTWWVPRCVRRVVGKFLFVTLLRQDESYSKYDRMNIARTS